MSRDSDMPSAEAEILSVQRQRRFAAAEKQRLVQETYEPVTCRFSSDHRALGNGSFRAPAIYNTGGTVIVGSANVQVNNQRDEIKGMIWKDYLERLRNLDTNQRILKDFAPQCSRIKSKGATPSITDGETGKWYTDALKKIGKGAVKSV